MILVQICSMTVTFGYSSSSRMAAPMNIFQNGFQSRKRKELLAYCVPEPLFSHTRQVSRKPELHSQGCFINTSPQCRVYLQHPAISAIGTAWTSKVPTAEPTWVLTWMGLLSTECSFHAALVSQITQPLQSRSWHRLFCSSGSNVLGRCHCMLSQWPWTKWSSRLWRCHLFDESFQWIIVKELLEKRINHKWRAYAIFVLGIDGQKITEKISILEYGINKNVLKFSKSVRTFLMFFWEKMKA